MLQRKNRTFLANNKADLQDLNLKGPGLFFFLMFEPLHLGLVHLKWILFVCYLQNYSYKLPLDQKFRITATTGQIFNRTLAKWRFLRIYNLIEYKLYMNKRSSTTFDLNIKMPLQTIRGGQLSNNYFFTTGSSFTKGMSGLVTYYILSETTVCSDSYQQKEQCTSVNSNCFTTINWCQIFILIWRPSSALRPNPW